jgi:hypothetical protein
MIISQLKKLISSHSSEKAMYAIFTIAYVAICMHLPVSLYTLAMHDDAHFWKLASNIVRGCWVGGYDQLALCKGLTYPIFLAINNILGLPATLSIALLYAIACYFFVQNLIQVGLARILALILFILILFEPALFPVRLTRDNIYPALTLLSVAFLIRILFTKATYKHAILCGVSIAGFLMTREEGVWLMPSILVLCIGAYLIRKNQNGWKVTRKSLFKLISVAMISSIGPMAAVSIINYVKCGYFGTVDFKGKQFKRCLHDLQTVVVGHPIPHVPVTAASREAIYQASPSFHELRNFLEVGIGRGWTLGGQGLYPNTENDFVGGWFMWALRDAVASQGYYKSGQTAEKYYGKIADEIEKAQREGKLPRVFSFSFVPVLSKDNLRLIPSSAWSAVKVTNYKEPISINGGPSSDPNSSLNNAREFLGNPKSIPSISEQKVSLSGWFYSKEHRWIDLVSQEDGGESEKIIKKCKSKDVAENFKDPFASMCRFNLEGVSPKSEIHVQGSKEVIPVSKLINAKGKQSVYGSNMIFIDGDFPLVNASPGYEKLKINLINIYSYISPFLLVAGIVSCLYGCFALFFRSNSFCDTEKTLLLVSLSLYLAYITRVAICVLVDISAFPAINTLYLGVAFPIIFSASFVAYGVVFANPVKSNLIDVKERHF